MKRYLFKLCIISILLCIQTLTAVNADVKTVCNRIGNKLGSVSVNDCLALDLKTSGGTSNQNTDILIKEFPPIGNKKPMGKVLLLGGIHGDEYSSVSVVFKWLKTLKKHHSGLFHWEIAPLVNPDGLLQKKSSRVNSNGVDLNRNFPVPSWSESPLIHWQDKTKQSPRRFPGKSPLSEPESQWIVDQIHRFQPDILVSVHAPHGIVDYDGPLDAPNKLGRLHLNLLGTYPGSLGRYAGTELNIPVVTIELPHAGIMPSKDEISAIWVDLVRYIKKNLKQQEITQHEDYFEQYY